MKLASNIIEIKQGIVRWEQWLKDNPNEIPTYKPLYKCLNISAMYIRSLVRYVNNNCVNDNYEYIPTLLQSNNNEPKKLKEILHLIQEQLDNLRDEFWHRAINSEKKYLSPKLIELYYIYYIKDNITTNNTNSNNNKFILNINIDKNNTNIKSNTNINNNK